MLQECTVKGCSSKSGFYGKQNKCKTHILEFRATRYRTNKDYFLTIKYAAMKQRAEGRSTRRSGSEGLPIISKAEFLEWHKQTSGKFNKLWKEWEESKWSISASPSVDRIDSSKGYEKGNLQWLSWYDNCVKGNKDINYE